MMRFTWVLLCLFSLQITGCSQISSTLSGNRYDEKKLVQPGKISGVSENARTKKPIAGAKVEIFKDGKKLVTKKTKADGKYSVPVEAGKYTVKISPKGHIAETIHVDVKKNETTTIARLRQVSIVESNKKTGKASGKVLDAITGKPIGKASLRIRRGVGVKTGKVVGYGTTDASGSYQTKELPAGNYTVAVGKTNHITTHFNVLVINDMTKKKQNVALSPRIAKGSVRIVLSWADRPMDLDSHLITPTINGRSYHIYYAHKGRNYPQAKSLLDIDRLNRSYIGPETITISQSKVGIYKYYVLNYSQYRGKASSQGRLLHSRAKVEVYTSKGLARTFHVPNTGKGLYWNVFEYNGSSGSIKPVNAITTAAVK